MADVPWTWLAIRASGITAWGLLTAVVVWGILLRTRILGRLAPELRLLDLHRWLGAIALGFLVTHMALLLVDPAVQFTVAQILVPGMAPWQTLAVALGTVAFWLIVPVSFLGRLRARMGQAGNRWFQRTHLVAYAAWPIATAHYVLAGTDALAEWSLALLFAGTGLVVTALLARGFVPAPGPHRPIPGESADSLTSA
jgi:sulfoxide reductase heme-binding subunit YedZ